MDKNIGKKLDGRYEITELIGVGGMADVYKATDILEGKTVAVKILKNEFMDNEEFIRRFRNESKAIAVLSHPNIVKIFDVGFTEKIQFIVMEHIDGITLKEFMEQQGVLKWKDSVHFIVQILRALQHAHDRGIVHRDVKPQNIMLFPDGTIKVMDFGIARFAREEGRTISDKAIGSVHYISPEQARGDITDEKSDIYSIGAMLYEMLTGVKPFDGDNPVAVALMHMQEEAEPPRSINDSIPEGLEEIIIRTMQKEPSKRYQSASEMIKDIDEFKKNPSIVFEYTYISDKTQYYSTSAVSRAAAAYEANAPKGNLPARATERSVEMKKQKAVPARVNSRASYEYDDYADYDYDEYDDYGDETVSKSSYFVVVLTAIAAVVIILVVGFIAYVIRSVITPELPPTLQMPNLVGLNFQEAKSYYTRNFELRIEEQVFSVDKPEGAIISHSPEAGEDYVDGRGIVRAVVSRGTRMATVPRNVGVDSTGATAALRGEGFNVRIIMEFSDSVVNDIVIRSDPPQGAEIPYGTEVTLFVSRGDEEANVVVPSLVGKTITNARASIGDGLTIQEVQVSDLAPEGTILEQSLPSHKEDGEVNVVRKGSLIVLSVSTGDVPAQDAVISFSLPNNATGRGTFNCYFNGVIVGTSNIDNLAYASTVNISVNGNGIQRIILEAVNDDTGNSAQIGDYTVDFTVAPPSVTANSTDREAFRSVFSGATTTVTTPYIPPYDPYYPYDPFTYPPTETTTDEEWWNNLFNGY